MSSPTDAKTARIARLETLLKIQEEESDYKIGELEQKLADLREELRLSAEKPKDPAPQPTATTGSSDSVQRAEITRLQQEVATKVAEIASKDAEIRSKDAEIRSKDAEIRSKDAEIRSKDATIARQYRISSDYESYLNQVARDIHRTIDRTREAAAAGIDGLPRDELAPKVGVTDSDRSSEPASSSPKDVKDEGETRPKTTSSSSPTKDVKDKGETEPKTPSFGFTPAKVPADAAPAPPGPAKPNYAQVLQTPKPELSFGNKFLPSDFTQRGFSLTKTTKQQAPSAQPKETRFVKPNRSPGHEKQRPERGSMSRDDPPKVQYPLTPRQATPGASRETFTTNTRQGENAKKSADQPSRESDIDLSVAASKLQIEQKIPVHENKQNPLGPSPAYKGYVMNTEGLMFDNEGIVWDGAQIIAYNMLGLPIPPEVKAAIKSGALPVSTAHHEEIEKIVNS